MGTTSNSRVWDLVFKVLAAATVPLIGWGLRLSTQVAVLETRLNQVQDTVVATQKIKVGVQQNAKTLARLDEKLSAVKESLQDVKALVQALAR